ncbi:hypothetical protein D3C87_1525680 [compost metagenome]
MCGQGDARAFEYVDHAEQSNRVVPGNQVVEKADHQFDRQGWVPIANHVPVAATGMNVIEHPLFVAILVLDVIAHGFAQPFQTQWQTRPAGHHQWHGMSHVVVRLRQKGPVTFQADVAFQRITDDRQVEQLKAFLLSGFLQRVEKTHGADSSEKAGSVSCPRKRSTMASRRSRPLAVSKPLAGVNG